MAGMSRREFAATAAGALLLPGIGSASGGAAPAPAAGDMSLIEALSKRRSTRLFSDAAVDEKTLETLLWCAFGVNRPESGGRTAPSWHTSNDTDIYVADAGGIRRFDPIGQALAAVTDADIRSKASPQPFVATAPTVLVYVSDLARMYKAPLAEQLQAAHVNAGIIAQNVYLYCASVGLGTCIVGGADKAGLAKILELPETQVVTYVQPVGHPKQPA